MFDIGWSELVVIGVVALIAIGPKELPGVLRMIGQWVGKARRMASDFQGQFNEAMREAEMADIKKSFDDISAASRDLHPTKLLASLEEHAREREQEEQRSAQATSDTPAADMPPIDTASASEPAATPVEGQASALMKETPDAPPTAPESKAS
ncbi:Sec-independent protein translocase protein TatB [[Pseudomonas] carboxydohydrogena]|uniref:Sec-independent protein translocase protein TatB n=1 Tax=Afipia carboxydohydrogena TaxID=290 RepID=A0ABY8BP86_AFICR|nr:Sec-independent protein translocase protein TatB [[Pseudomonas] carboxydohydrogena]WEF50117.1 Sec-independent protein translocase protein TatB [[Pseudomonas] carboxydohydrogena]